MALCCDEVVEMHKLIQIDLSTTNLCNKRVILEGWTKAVEFKDSD